MQIKDYYLKHAPSFWKAAGVVVAGLALLLVYKRFAAEHTNLTAVVWPKSSFLTIGIVTALMLVNWSLEAWRWRISVRVFERVTFLQSLRTVLAGLALNWVLPLTSGDALSRVIERTDKYKAATAMVLNRAIMLLLTCLFGLVSVMYYSKASVEINLLLPSILMVMLVLFFLFRRYLGQFLSYFTQIRKRVLLGIVGISLLRYAVFVFQFFLLLQLFLPELSAPYLLLGIGWIFFFSIDFAVNFWWFWGKRGVRVDLF